MDTLNNPDGLQDSVDPVEQLVGMLASPEEDGITKEPAVKDDHDEGDVDDHDLQGDEGEEHDLEVGDDENLGESANLDDDNDNDDDDDEDLFTVKVNGEEKQVTQDDLVKAYQLDAVITQKSQAVSDKEKVLDTKLDELTQVREQQVLSLQAVVSQDQVILSELDKTNWEELKAVDPDAFMLKREERREVTERIQATEQQQLKIATDQQTQNVERFNLAKEKANEILSGPSGIPGWADEKEGPVVRKKVREFAEKMGFSSDDLKTMIDPRALKLLDMARQFSELEAVGKDLASRKAKKRNPKSVRKTSRTERKGAVGDLKEQASKAKQSGDGKDAADFFMSIPNF